MNLLLGNKIKALRKARRITQEKLAAALGISFQAVSKWENNIALPDITLAPAIASYFGITMDELFDFNLKEMAEKIEAICSEAYKYRESDPDKSRQILENGLKQYPDNDILLNNLLYVITSPDEKIAVAAHLIDSTEESDVKYDALRFLAYAYNDKGDADSAIAALEQLPELYFTKLSEMAFILTGKPKYEAAEKQKWISFEILLQMMAKIAECYEADGRIRDAMSEISGALSLIEALKDDTKAGSFRSYAEFFHRWKDRLESKEQ